MRENCTSGSEGGGVEANRLSLPLSPRAAQYARRRAIAPYEVIAFMESLD